MLPLGHAAFAYLWYAVAAVAVRRRPPTGAVLLPLLFASQLPDLIDKPLAFVGLLPSGRSLGHSLFALVVLALAVALACRALADAAAAEGTSPRVRDLLRRTPLAFAVGYASHLAGDGLGPLLAGRYDRLSFLLYPFVPAPVYPNDAVAPWTRLWRVYVVDGTVATRPRARGIVLVAAVVFVAAHVWRLRRRRLPD